MAYIPRIGSFKRTCHFCRLRRCRAKPFQNYHIIFRASFSSSNSPLREAKMPSLMLRLKSSALSGLKKITAKQVKLEVTTVALFIRSYEPWPSKVLPAKLHMICPLLSFKPCVFLSPDSQENSRSRIDP